LCGTAPPASRRRSTPFTNTIADLLSAENKQWLHGTAQANAAIDKLDEQLSQLGKPKGADVAAN
jgi:hypothetical protein